MPKKQQYYRIDIGKNEGVYELGDIVNVKVDKKERILCPCCNKPLKPQADVIQWGFWQDTYTTYFLCKPCIKVWRYSYVVVCEVAAVDTSALEADAQAAV
jgi:hypothetical protein